MFRVHWLRSRFALLLAAGFLCLSPVTHAQTTPQVCDCDADGDVDKVDINLIANARGKAASGPTDPRDPDRDLKITSADARTCTARCTFAKCASPTNRPPIADAGRDQTVFTDQQVTLDGSDSTDPDGDPLTFRWTFVRKPAGSTAALTGASTVSPRFTPDIDGVYEVQLIVNDGQVDSAPDTVIITTGNAPPVADAGDDKTVVVNSLVTLDGSGSSDINGDPLTYSWSFVQRPAGSNATLSSSTAVMPTFTPDRAGVYRLRLVVNDGRVNSAPDEVVIDTRTQPNEPPIADAGDDQTVDLNATVTLDGSGSRDPDNGPSPLTYSWSLLTRPVGSTAVLSNPTAVRPSFRADKAGEYVIQLIVNDGADSSAPDTVRITTRNTRPVADAGDDQTRNVGATVALDGTGSFDADGDPLSYQWSFTSRPGGSSATIANPQQPTTSFVADRPGMYVVQLVVNDGQFDSLPDTATITIIVPTVPSLSINNASITEGNAGTKLLSFAVTLSPAAGGTVTVAYATANGTATTADADYVAKNATLTYTGGQTSKTVTVTVRGDTKVEPDEDFFVNLSNASANATIADGQGVGTIINDDTAALPTVTVLATDPNASEAGPNTGTFTISRTGPTTAALLIVGTFEGTASNGADYGSSVGNISIPIGQSSVTWTITPIDDSAVESSETVIYRILSGEYVIGAQGSATVTIADNDTALPTVTIAAPDAAAGETSPNPGPGRFAVTRTGATTSPLTVNYSVGGSAINGTDFTTIATSVTIAAGQSTGLIDINPINDTAVEAQESVILGILPNAAYTIGSPSAATVTIADNDVGALVQFVAPTLNIAQNLQEDQRVQLSAGTAPAGGLALRIVSSSPNVLLSATPTGTGAQTLNLTVPANNSQTPQFFVYSLAGSGTASLTVEILTTPNPGFSPGTPAAVTMTPAGYELLCQQGGCTVTANGSGITTTAQAAPSLIYIQAQQLTSSTSNNRGGVQNVRGGTTINLPLSVSNASLGVFRAYNGGTPGGTITQLTIPAGQYYTYFFFDPNDASSGSATISFTKPAGAGTPLTSGNPYAQTIPVTVAGSTPINFSVPANTVGKDLQTSGVYLIAGGPAPAGGLSLRLTSSNANALLSSSATAAGSQTLDLTIPAGSTQSPFLYVQSLASSGTANVSIQVLTSPNPGFAPGPAYVATLVPSGFQLFCFTSGCTTTNNQDVLTTTNSNTNRLMYIEASQLNPANAANNIVGAQNVRGGFTVTVPLTLTNTGIGALRDYPSAANTITQISIVGGQYYTYFYFDPNNASTGGNGTINYTKPAGAGTPTLGGQPRRQAISVVVTQ